MGEGQGFCDNKKPYNEIGRESREWIKNHLELCDVIYDVSTKNTKRLCC